MTTDRERLDQIEQTISVPDTQQGGEQRLYLRVPTHASQLAMGARGSKYPVGPPGIALSTTAHFAVQVGQNTILDGDGNVIFHSVGETRVLAESDAAISSNAHLRVGTAASIEITAGDAGFADPNFRGGAIVPPPPQVDTASPRAPAEAENAGLSSVWSALDALSAVGTLHGLRKGLTSGVAAGNLMARVSSLLGVARAAESLFTAAWDALQGAADAFEIELPEALQSEPSGPKLKMHGAGGVALTSPEGITAYGGQKVSLQSARKVSIKSGWSSSVKSAGNAKLFGGASAQVASQGVVGIKGRVISVSGDLAELKAAQVAAINGRRQVHIESDDSIAIDAPTVGVAGDNSFLDARVAANVHGKDTAVLSSESAAEVRSRGTARVEGDARAALVCGNNGVAVSDDQVQLTVGSAHVSLQSDRLSLWRFRVERGEIHLSGQVYLG